MTEVEVNQIPGISSGNIEANIEADASIASEVLDSICEKVGLEEQQQNHSIVDTELKKEEIQEEQDPKDDDELIMADEVGEDDVVDEPEELAETKPEKIVTEQKPEPIEKVTQVVLKPAKKDQHSNGTAAQKPAQNIRRIARVPRNVMEYMMNINDETVTINVTQLRIWAQGELYNLGAEIPASDWKTAEVPLIVCDIPEAAVDKYDVIVNRFGKESNRRESERIHARRKHDGNHPLRKKVRGQRKTTKQDNNPEKAQAEDQIVKQEEKKPTETVPAKILPAKPEKVSGANNNNRAQDKMSLKRPIQSVSGEAKKQNNPAAKKQKNNNEKAQVAKNQEKKNKETFPKKNENNHNDSPKKHNRTRTRNNNRDQMVRETTYHNQNNESSMREMPRNEVWTSPVQQLRPNQFNMPSSYPQPIQNASPYNTINNQMNGSWSSPWQSTVVSTSMTDPHIQAVPPPVPRAQIDLSSTALSTLLNKITSSMVTRNNVTGMQPSQPMRNERDLSQYIEPLDNFGSSAFASHNAMNSGIGSVQYNGYSSVSEPVNPIHYNLGNTAPISSSVGLPYSDFISCNTFAVTGSSRQDDFNHRSRDNNQNNNSNNSASRRRRDRRRKFHGK